MELSRILHIKREYKNKYNIFVHKKISNFSLNFYQCWAIQSLDGIDEITVGKKRKSKRDLPFYRQR